MYVADLLEMISSDPSKPASTDSFAALLSRRVRSEGIVAIAQYATKVHKRLMTNLAMGIECDDSDAIGIAATKVLQQEGPIHSLNITGFLSKVVVLGINPEADYDGFAARCLESSNHRGEHISVSSVFKMYVAENLGPAPDNLQCKHGPGATSDHLVGWDKWLVLKDADPYRALRCSKLTDVPKDISKRRIIAIESAESQFFQQGVARALRGTSLFRKITCLANHERHLALAAQPRYMTIDLSDASDRVSWSLVEALLPPDWVALLGRFSSGIVRFPTGETRVAGMAATMGCGFCFELESLIHGLLIVHSMLTGGESRTDLANLVRQISVYGDDIVMPREWYPDVHASFTQFGLEINPRKTCLTSHFRETVGHWIVGNAETGAGTVVRRFLPQLNIDPDGQLVATDSQVFDLAIRSYDAFYETLSTFLLNQRDWRVRMNSKLMCIEVELDCALTVERPLNVIGETRSASWFLTGNAPLDPSDPQEAVPGITRQSRAWVPISHEFWGWMRTSCSHLYTGKGRLDNGPSY